MNKRGYSTSLTCAPYKHSTHYNCAQPGIGTAFALAFCAPQCNCTGVHRRQEQKLCQCQVGRNCSECCACRAHTSATLNTRVCSSPSPHLSVGRIFINTRICQLGLIRRVCAY